MKKTGFAPVFFIQQDSYSISKSILSLLPSPSRATALSAARRLDSIDLEMELANKLVKNKPSRPNIFNKRIIRDFPLGFEMMRDALFESVLP